MLALVIDTSSAAVTAGVVRVSEPGSEGGGPADMSHQGVEVLAARVTVDARAHGELLAPSVSDALAAAGIAMSQLDSLVVGLGPGPFTGLRVGLVSAAAIADVLGVPAYGVCSLDAIAASVSGDERVDGATAGLLVATDARRKEVYWAVYRDAERIGGPEVDKPAHVQDRLRAAGLDVGRMSGAGARRYAEELGVGRRPDEPGVPLLGSDYPTVAGLAVCARERILGGAPTDVLTPLYLRRPDAVAATSHKRVST